MVITLVIDIRRILIVVRIIINLIVAFINSISLYLARYKLFNFRRYFFIAFKVVKPSTIFYNFLKLNLNFFKR